MSELKPKTAQEFATKYAGMNVKITQNAKEKEGFILGYCKCGCENILLQLLEPGKPWVETDFLVLTATPKKGFAWVSIRVNEFQITELPPDFRDNVNKLNAIITAKHKSLTKKERAKMLLEYDALFAKVEEYLTKSEISSYMNGMLQDGKKQQEIEYV